MKILRKIVTTTAVLFFVVGGALGLCAGFLYVLEQHPMFGVGCIIGMCLGGTWWAIWRMTE